MFLSEQLAPHMAAAARIYGEAVLDADQEASVDPRATLGRRLLQEIFGIRDRNGPLPDAVQALIVDPEDPEARDRLEGHVQGVLTDDPVLAAVVADTLTRFYRNEIDAGNIRAMRDLGDLLRGQDDLDGARAAYQRAADSGNPDVAPEALVDLGHLLMIFQRDYGGASAYFRQAISSAHPEWSAAGLVGLALALVKHGDTAGAKDAYQHAIESGDNDTAARASVFLGDLLQKQGDTTGARNAYLRVIDSRNAVWAPPALTEPSHVPASTTDASARVPMTPLCTVIMEGAPRCLPGLAVGAIP